MPRRQIEQLNLPPGFKVYSPAPWGSLNQQDDRQFIGDAELYWRENFIRIGNGKLRATYDIGPSFYTAPSGKKIISFFWFAIGKKHDTFAVFLSDGSAQQVDLSTSPVTITTMGGPGTFYNGTRLPACCQYGSQYLLISNSFNANNYWIWDGSLLFHSGTVGPQVTILSGGSGYTSPPIVSTHGGAPSPAPTFQANIENGIVTSVSVTNPGAGFQVTDFVSLVFTGGGGDSQATAIASVDPASGGISAVAVVNGGAGYSSGAIVTISGGGGTGASLALEAINGTITQIVVVNPGTGFTSAPTIGVDDSHATHPGSGFVGIATLNFGQITFATVTSPGSGYTSPPTVVVLGDGVGAQFQTLIDSGGALTGINVINPGHSYTNAVLDIRGGNNAANATAELMPFGVSGTALETYQSRVWLTFPNSNAPVDNGGTILLSAPASLTDFATADGGLIFVNNDRYLRTEFTAIRQTNGYLYPFGDSSVSVISNVQTAGNPTTTTFNFQNTDPQIGAEWPNSLQDYGRTILFGNRIGVFGLYGGSVTKISQKIDNLFTGAPLAPLFGVEPSSAVANLFSQRVYLLLRTIYDPLHKEYRTVMLGWDEREWGIYSASITPSFIGTREVDSDIEAWATDGTGLYPLFSRPSNGLIKTIATKLYGSQSLWVTKAARNFYMMALDETQPQTNQMAFTALIENESATYPMFPEPQFPAATINGTSRNFFFSKTPDVASQLLGFQITSTSKDFSLQTAILAYEDVAAFT